MPPCRCYSDVSPLEPKEEGVGQLPEVARKELEPLKLPGKLSGFTGNVMYPNDDSAVWDVNREYTTCYMYLHACIVG